MLHKILSNIIQLPFRSVYSTKLLRSVSLESTIKYNASGWSSRRPVSIVNEDELFDTNNTNDTDDIQKTVKEKYKRVSGRRKKPKRQDSKENTETAAEESMYTILKEDDKLISSLMIDVKTKNRRGKNNEMLLEGFRLIKDAIQAGVMPKVVFFSRLSDVLPLSLPKEVKLYKIPYRTIQLWSNLTTSPGILGICDIPDVTTKTPAIDAIPLTIICDNIREPGNLGTIVRIAAAVGCEKLLLMKGCVDLWDPKVLRGAVGAHFRMPIFTSLTWNDIPTLISNESDIFIADNNITYETKSESNVVNSDLDINTEIKEDCSDMKRDNLDVNINDNGESDEIRELITKLKKPTVKSRFLVKKIISEFPVVPYHTLNFTKKEAVLIVGGETEGVSLELCEVLRMRSCTRVNISLTNNVDSLNIASAVSIITFEMKRQFITHKIDNE